MQDIGDIRRIATEAQKTSTQADHNAKTALLLQSNHEKVCAERYQGINKQLDTMAQTQKDSTAAQVTAFAKIWEKLDTMSAGAHQAKGMEILFRLACMAIAAAGVIFGIAK